MSIIDYKSLIHNSKTAYAIFKRDLYVIRSRLRTIMIDSFIVLMVQVITFGYLFPLLGMPIIFIPPLYIGSIVSFIFFLSFGYGLRLVFDLKHNRFFEYHLILPLEKKWLFAAYLAAFVVETTTITLPIIIIGILLLGNHFILYTPAWILFAILYLLTMILFNLIFLTLSFRYEFDWFMQNVWPRRLTPLFCFSPIFFTWYSVYSFSPYCAYALLFNPITYVTEGLRAGLLAGSDYYYIPILPAIMVTGISSLLSMWLLSLGIKKRLDPV